MMPIFAALSFIGDIGLPKITITPAEETQSEVARIQSMKLGNHRNRYRTMSNTITINNRSLPVRWVA
jgi:hypothetical protein